MRASSGRKLLMNKTYCMAALAVLAFGATGANADVDISVALRGEIVPGVYGRIDLGGRPPPTLVYSSPVLIEQPPPHVVMQEPIYLHVPPEHARDWRLHCGEYHACNRRVYFVRSAEYEPGYVRGDQHERREDLRRDEHDRRKDEHEMRREEHERRKEERRDDHDHGHDYDAREHDHDR